MAKKLIVAVLGATGQQGGAVVKTLLERGHDVRAFTRDPDSDKAKALAAAGATVVQANVEDTAALTKALKGATSLFAMTTPYGVGVDIETQHGISAANAAKAAGVHLVYTSVGSADQRAGVPHFDSKYKVEQHIAKIGARASIVAPVYFMENIWFGKDQLAKGVYASALTAGKNLAQIAVADIGHVSVRLLENPDRYEGKRFDLGGDDLSGNDVAALLSRLTGRSFNYFQVPIEVIRQHMGEDAVKMYEWFENVGYTIDRAALRRDFPDLELQTFESWAKAQDWNFVAKAA